MQTWPFLIWRIVLLQRAGAALHRPAFLLCCCSAAGQLRLGALPCLARLFTWALTTPSPLTCRRMLVKDPGQRISMPGIMAHRWFQKVSAGYTWQQLRMQQTAWLPVCAFVAAPLASWWA